jgi:MarR family transcriptional regulator, 2-MHQ and catechol-resistance regulon repressor
VTITLKDKKDRALAAYAEFVRANEKLNLLLENQLRGFKLTDGQFRVLETLRRGGPMSQADLSQRISRNDSDVYVITANLEKRGLAVRRAHDTDRRKVSIHLTPQGRKLITNFLPHRAKLTYAQITALNWREQGMLKGLCEKLAEGDPVKFVLEMTRADADERDEE